MNDWKTLAWMFAWLLAGTAQAETTPLVLRNGFDMEFPFDNETYLTSSGECGRQLGIPPSYCSIRYRFESSAAEATIQVTWKDAKGITLLTAHNRSNWTGTATPTNDFEWGETRSGYGYSGVLASYLKQVTGKADFTGSKSHEPCSDGYVCAVDYHAWLPSPFGGGGGGGGSDRLTPPAGPAAAAAEVELPTSEIVGALSLLQFDPLYPGDYDKAIRTDLFTFKSAVEAIGSDYRYTYSVTNLAEDRADFQWDEAGLAGTSGEAGSSSRSLVSALAPAIIDTQVGVQFPGAQFTGQLGLLQPVPEPSSLAIWLAGGGVLGYRLSRRRAANTP